MSPKEQKTVMIVMVSLIVLLVMSLSYIWITEQNIPLFGKNLRNKLEIQELEEELKNSRQIIDSLSKIQETVPSYELRRHQPDSLLCKNCPSVENINGKYYELYASFHTADDARYLVSQLLKVGISNLKIFHRNGLQAEEVLLIDTLNHQ
ncbi:MAG: hypothetical protein HYZ42_14690 [Bacteroidetes bacterium]|nr:hypothetical protein [Bacteroidota bacterium]